MGKITDIEASQLAYQAYEEYKGNIPIIVDGDYIDWKTTETIQGKNTGLNGYIFENEETGQIVVSFEGTQLEKGTTQAVNDLKTDIEGIIFGGSNYTKEERNAGEYRGSPSQDGLIAGGNARIDQDGNFIRITENQFTVANDIVKETVEKYGKENVTFTGHSLGGGLAEYFAVKYDVDAITFASAPVYDLLTDEEQKRVANGDFKDQIISYTYSDDIVGTFKDSIGSKYYMNNPQESEGKNFDNHGITESYRAETMFDENGYFKAELLYDETLHRQLTRSPLEMKNNGIHGFSIIIKSAILKAYALDIEKNANLIENTETSFKRFYDYYIDTMQGMKSKYIKQAGTGNYDLLTIDDVEEAFANLGKLESGVPILFSIEQYEEILANLRDMKHDTGEIAYHMDKMGNDFEETDILLAQWLGLKGG